MAMNVVAKRSENERVPNALFILSLAPSGSNATEGLELGADVVTSPPIESTADDVSMELATVGSTEIEGSSRNRRVHSPVPLDAISQYASDLTQVFVHLAILHVASLSPSHSSKTAMLEAE